MRRWPARIAVVVTLWATAATAGAITGTAAPPGGASSPARVSANAHQHLVACAPGYPGSTRQAQPTMDEFAAMLATAAGLPVDGFSAEYQEREQPGLERLRDPASTLALVPLAFFLKYEQELALRPFAQVVDQDGHSSEVWSLVAAADRVHAPADLDGWQLTGIPAYAPAFVRGPVLGRWGTLPAGARIVFGRRVLGALRRVAAGDAVAVLLDRAQTAALADLPNAEAYEVVAQSPELPIALLASVGGRVPDTDLDALRAAVLRVHESERFHEVLDTLRLSRFVPLDRAALESARAAYRAAL